MEAEKEKVEEPEFFCEKKDSGKPCDKQCEDCKLLQEQAERV